MSEEQEDLPEAAAEQEPTPEPRELTDEDRAKLAELDQALEKFESQKRWSDVIKTILAKAEIVVDSAEKVDLFRQAGMLYIERSSNQAEAIKCFEKVIAIEPENAEAIMHLKEMYEKRRDWEKLIGMMEREAALLDPADRGLRYAEMAELATKRIRKPDICIGLWEKVMEFEPTNPQALEQLAHLYERARNWEPLAKILETLTEADPDPKMLQKLGMIYADKIGDDAGAVGAFKRLLTIDPNDRRAQEQLKRRYVALKAWDELEEFYGAADKYDELIRILEREADGKETEAEDRVALLFRAAVLWMTQKGKPDRAARAYEKILESDPTNLDAAEALSPIYERAGDARKLVRVYEVRLKNDMEPEARVALLREAGLLYEEKLRSPDTAFEKYLEAFQVAPTQEIVREDVERLAEATGSFEQVVAAYGLAIEGADVEEDEIELRMNFGRVLQKVENVEESIRQFRAVYDLRSDHAEAIAQLGELYATTENWSELLTIYGRRMDLEQDPDIRRQIAYRRAALYEEQLSDADQAIDAYNDILGEWGQGEADAFRALDRLYEGRERWQDLADTLQRRIDLMPESTEELASLKFRLGRTNEQRLNEKPGAVELYREVLTLMPDHEGARAALESLLDDDEVGVSAARILEPIYEMAGEYTPLIRALRVLHDGQDDPDTKLELMTKIGEVYAERLDDADQAFAALSEAFAERPDSTDTLARLETIAIAQDRFPQLVELVSRLAASVDDPDLCRSLWIKAANIHDTQLQEVDGAVAAYRKVLDLDEGDLEVLAALDSLFRRTERWSDLVGVMRRRIEQSADPMEKEELLAQMATIYDEFLQDPDTAISVHREILELDPTSQRALRALDDLLARRELWTDLADNVERQLELAADPQEQVELMLRAAQLRETRMNATDAAVEIYRDVLDRDPENQAALVSLERLLQVEDSQLHIAEILEPIYRASGAVPKLINVHEIQARHASSPDRRVELLHRIAELYEVSLDDYASAFRSYSRALAEDPSSSSTQQQLERLSPMMGDMEALAKTYEEQVQDLDDPVLAAHLHIKAAQIREEQLGDMPGAIAHYQRVLELDDTHLEAATALERLFQLSERYEDLAKIYLQKAGMLHSPDEQKEYLYRGAAIYEELLERPNDAIAVYHQALEIDPEDEQSLDKLIELNLRLENWERLLEVYTAKADIVGDPEERKRLYIEVGAVYERELKDNDKAIDSYQRILEIDPDDLMALSRLDQLYQATENWQELLSVLEREADLAGDPNEVISYRYRIADLWHHRLDDATRAIDIYRDILDVTPDHEPTLTALQSMIEAGKEPVAAAAVLEPVYRNMQAWPHLIAVHEVQIAYEEDPLRQVELLHQVAELNEFHLNQVNEAFQAYARALPLDNRHDQTLGSLERLAENIDAWPSVTQLYDVEVQRLREESPDDVVEMALRTAQIYEVQIGDVDSAIDRYRTVLEADAMHVQAIEALDRLYEATERWTELAGILEREVEVAGSPEDILTLQFRLGQVHQEHLNNVDGAIEQYQEILAAAPEHSSAMSALELLFAEGTRPLRIGEILEPLYRMQEAWDRLLNVHEVQLNYQPDPFERVSMMHRIAEIAEERANDHERAFVWLQRAILEDPSHDHSVSEAERLGSLLDGWPQLASTYADTLVMHEAVEPRVEIGKRLARVYEEELGDVARAEETYRFVLGVEAKDDDSLQALDRIYSDYRAPQALAAVLRSRIAATDIPQDLVELHYRLGQVLEHDLEQTAEAIGVYNHILGELEKEHGESIAALEDIYTRQQAWPELYGAFEKELDVVFGDTQQAEILAKMARLASLQLGDNERAIELWRRVLDMRGEDAEALNALGNIYAEMENWADLVDILEREVSIVDDDGMRVQIYSDLGRIWYEKLERERSALESWERVLDIDPGNTNALFHIAEIYRASNQNTELVDTLHRIIEVGAATLEDSQIENVYMQLGHLYYSELQQPMDAVDAYNRALDVNPRNFEAMDALELIHRSEAMWEDVVQVMERRAEAFDEPDQKVQQLLTVARTWAEQLEEPDRGSSAYLRILEIDPMHDYAFQELDGLHREALRWEDLIDMYINRVENSEDTEERVRLLGKVARIMEERLDDSAQAFDMLQLAWSLDYNDDKTFEELTRITRLTNKWNDLLTAANAALQEAEDQETQITLCLQCAKWYGQELDHPDYALPYYQRVQAVDPGNVQLMISMAELYEKTQQWDALAQTYGQIVTSTKDAQIQADTYVKMGELAMTHLGLRDQAGGYYEKALDAQAGHVEAIDALERIYTENGQWAQLIEILERKTAAVDDQERVIAAKLKLAEVYEDRTQEIDKAVATYQEVCGADEFNLPALKGLERLYARTERWQDLLQVLETQFEVVSTEKERIQILTQLAGMWEEEFVKPDRAAERLEQVLEIDPMHEGALGGLARLYRQMQKWDELLETYERHISATPDRAEKIRIYKALGQTYMGDLDDADRAVDAYLNVLSIDDQDIEALDALTRIYDKRGDHASALDMMEQLARLVSEPDQQVDLLYRMGRIYDQELGDEVSALDRYQMAIDIEPGHLQSLAAMRQLQIQNSDWISAAKLLEQEASYQQNPRVVATLLVELGDIYDSKLDERSQAVETYQRRCKATPTTKTPPCPWWMSTRRPNSLKPRFRFSICW